MILKATKKPVTIECIKWEGDNLFEVQSFIEGREIKLQTMAELDYWERFQMTVKKNGLIVKTLEGQHIASVGDYIIKGVKGEFYPCKPDIFLETYDIVEK